MYILQVRRLRDVQATEGRLLKWLAREWQRDGDVTLREGPKPNGDWQRDRHVTLREGPKSRRPMLRCAQIKWMSKSSWNSQCSHADVVHVLAQPDGGELGMREGRGTHCC